MKTSELKHLESNLESIFSRNTDFFIDENWVVVGENELIPDGDWIEEFLFTEAEPTALDGRTDSVDYLRDALERIDSSQNPQSASATPGLGPTGPSLEAGRAGTPGALRPKPERHVVPPPDCYAFYLPWHYFTARHWGIYLLVEGIEEFGGRAHARAQGGLTRAEARNVAKSFLFHHEAYHNAVETFSVRLEVSHRVPCYKDGFEKLYRLGFAHCAVHEEGLSTAYALMKVRNQLFASIPTATIRKLKRQIAYKVLCMLVRAMPPEYASALKLLPPSGSFDANEHIYQECAHSLSLPKIPGVQPEVWASALHSMGPSLQRNKSFSYVVPRSHPALRGALSVRYLSIKRKSFVQRLREVVGGEAVGGGKHPKWQAANGKKVPVPSGTDLNPYTCAQILKQLGLDLGIQEFMQG